MGEKARLAGLTGYLVRLGSITLIETVKVNGLEPYDYLRHLFTELPKATMFADIEALWPWNVDLTGSLGDATHSVAA